jgi:hypothetical protein
MTVRTAVFIVSAFAAIGASAAISIESAEAHQSGCHRWHSCPSDTGSYVCGDLGYYTYCGYGPTAPPPSGGGAPPPPTDSDSDGVPDATDTCPFTPAGTPDGCPAAESPSPPPGADVPAKRRSGERFVRRYYGRVSIRHFRSAWRMLGGRLHRKFGSYRGWKAGFRRSLGTHVRSARARLSDGRAVVRVSLRS